MKLSANLSMLFTEHPFLERFEHAACTGFDAVEFQFPYDTPVDDVRHALQSCGLPCVLFNLPAGDWLAGDRGLACDPARQAAFDDALGLGLRYADILRPLRMNCLLGLRPDPQRSDPHTVRQTAVNNLRKAAHALAALNIELMIEALNPRDVPGFYLTGLDMAADLIAETATRNLFIQYDLYHQQRNGGELIGNYLRHADLIRHIQIADNPGRHEPGTGEISYERVLPALRRAGYPGWIGCEYIPQQTTAAGLKWRDLFFQEVQPSQRLT